MTLRKQTLDMLRGGVFDVEEHGQISLGFYRKIPDEVRNAFREKLSELLRPRRSYVKRFKIDPLAVERVGERVLDDDDHDPIARNACVWFVRIFYVSQGDELLCFDAGPFVRITADNAKRDASHYAPGPKWSKEHSTWITPPDGNLPQPEVWHSTRDGEKIVARTNALGARHIVLPSHRASLQQRYNEAIGKDPTLSRAGLGEP